MPQHECAPESRGGGGKSHLHLTGGDRSQLAPQIRRRRMQRKRPMNKITLVLRPWFKEATKHLCCFSNQPQLERVLKWNLWVLCWTQSWSSTLSMCLCTQKRQLSIPWMCNHFCWTIASSWSSLWVLNLAFPPFAGFGWMVTRFLRSMEQKLWNKD